MTADHIHYPGRPGAAADTAGDHAVPAELPRRRPGSHLATPLPRLPDDAGALGEILRRIITGLSNLPAAARPPSPDVATGHRHHPTHHTQRFARREAMTDDDTSANPVEQPGFDQWLLNITATQAGTRAAVRLREVAGQCAHTGRTTTDPELARYATATATLLDHLATTTPTTPTTPGRREEPVHIDAWTWITNTCELSYELTATSLSLDIHPGTSAETTVCLILDPTTTLDRVLTLIHNAHTAHTTQHDDTDTTIGYYGGSNNGPVTCQAFARLREHTPLTYDIDDGVVRLDFGDHDSANHTAIRLELTDPDTLLPRLHHILTRIRTEHRTHFADGQHSHLRRARIPLHPHTTTTDRDPEPGNSDSGDSGGSGGNR